MRSSKLSKRKRANGAFTYFANIGGKQIGLGTDFQEAKNRFGELLKTAKPKDGSPNPLVRELIATFLTWCERNCAPATYEWYRRYLVGTDFVHIWPTADAAPNSPPSRSPLRC
jgi:hypothetical protein